MKLTTVNAKKQGPTGETEESRLRRVTGKQEVIDGSPPLEWQFSIQTTKSGVQISTPPQIKKMGRLSLPSCEPSA
jgi:hypothetical protein